MEIAASEGDLRLADGSNYGDAIYEGRVEIYHAGEWGTICNDIYYGPKFEPAPPNANTIATAQVICRQFGYGDWFLSHFWIMHALGVFFSVLHCNRHSCI